MSFEFVPAESQLGSVLCTPRTSNTKHQPYSNVYRVDWSKFMGVASDIGEDRAMTNMILKQR
jgi:hyaluronan synthase